MDLTLATDTIRDSGAVVTATCRRDPQGEVPSCPGWTVADLTAHTAGIHLWAASLIEGGVPGPAPEPPAGADVATWADEARERLLAVMGTADPDRSVWTFVGERPARWWWRRQANETAVHAWDATASGGAPWTIPSGIATDALDELLEVFLPRRWGHREPSWGTGRTVHLHRTDGDGEWLVTIGANPTVERSHAKGDLAVRGGADALLLWALGRPADGAPAVEIFGDAALEQAWRANVRI